MKQPEWFTYALADLRQQTGKPLTNAELTVVQGGDINTTYRLDSAELTLFIKCHAGPNASRMFQAEQINLHRLSKCIKLRVPRVVARGNAEHLHYLALEYVDMRSSGDWSEMGAALASLHEHTNCRYGWQSDNFIGTSPQVNKENDSWEQFWWHNRIEPQLTYCQSNGLSRVAAAKPRMHSINEQLLSQHQPEPSLLHGDLWSGNAAFDELGAPCLYDPACYYGDRETDLALSELFGGFAPEFYQHYQSCRPLPTGYEIRKLWYNLYHLLNHANLFGGHYADSCIRTLEKCEYLLSKRDKKIKDTL